MKSVTEELNDEISLIFRDRGADTGWMAQLSRVSTQMQSFEWQLLRRRNVASPSARSEKPGEPAG
jgi:hypothetical protein